MIHFDYCSFLWFILERVNSGHAPFRLWSISSYEPFWIDSILIFGYGPFWKGSFMVMSHSSSGSFQLMVHSGFGPLWIGSILVMAHLSFGPFFTIPYES